MTENIDFSLLSSYFSIPQITRWEEPLILNFVEKNIHIYRFGAVVFFGHSEKESFDFFLELEKGLKKKNNFNRTDAINCEIVENPPIDIKNWNDEEFYFDQYSEIIYFNKSNYNPNFLKIISFALAQSVSLERFDKLSEDLEDEVEKTMSWFKKYKTLLPVLANKLFDKTIMILKIRHTIMSDLMILDKPYTAWENIACDELYEIISRHFELNRRYKSISSKLDYGLDSAQTLSNMFQHSRANFLELLIVLMIFWEIIWELIKIKFK